MKRILGIVVVAFFAVFMIQCNGSDEKKAPTYPKCETNAHCESHNEVCGDGTCVECTKDTHCKGGCMGCANNKCEKKANCCVNDKDCASGQICKVKPGKTDGTCGAP